MIQLQDFIEAANQLSIQLKLPHLKPSDEGRCEMRYKDEFDVEIFLNPAGLQLHAYVLSLEHLGAEKESLFQQLLNMNNEGCDLAGGFFGIHEVAGFITFNAQANLTEIDSRLLDNILSNFLCESSKMRRLVQKKLSLTKPVETTADDHFLNANQFI